MAELPIEAAIPRFRQNESRVDQFVNGGPTETYQTTDGTEVPTIRKFVADLNAEGEGWLAEAQEAADRAEAAVTALETVVYRRASKFLGVAGQRDYTLIFAPLRADELQLWRNGRLLEPDVEYSILSVSPPVLRLADEEIPTFAGEVFQYIGFERAVIGSNAPITQPTVAALETYIAAEGSTNGVLYFGGGLRFLGVDGANDIPGLPGLVPLAPITFRHYGAQGDNVTDDTAACQAALTAHPDEAIDGEGLTYRIDGVLNFRKIHNANFRKVGNGSVLTAWGSPIGPVNPGVSPARGDITITSGAIAPLLQQGDWFAVVGTNDPYEGFMEGTSGGQTGELVQVRSISGSVITLTKPLFWTYTTGEALYRFNWLHGVELVNVDIEGDPTANPGTFSGGGELIDLRFCMKPRMINVTGHDNKMSVIMTHCCVDLYVESGGAWDLGSEITVGDGSGTGYGVLERGMNEGAIINGCNWNRIRTGYTTGAGLSAVWPFGVPTNTLVSGNSSLNSKQSGMSTHEAGLFQKFEGNVIDGAGSQGINLRAKYGKVSDNKISRSVGPGVLLINDGVDSIAEESTVENNVIEYSNYGVDPSGVDQRSTGAINDNTPSSVIRGNTIRKCGGPAIRTNFTQQAVMSGNIIIDPCQAAGVHGVTYAIGAASAGSGTPNWIVAQNTLIVTDGLCTTFVNKPNGVFARGSGNTSIGVPTNYVGEASNNDIHFTGGPQRIGRNTTQHMLLTGDNTENLLSGVSLPGQSRHMTIEADANSLDLRLRVRDVSRHVSMRVGSDDIVVVDNDGLQIDGARTLRQNGRTLRLGEPGSPEGVVEAPRGSVYTRSDGGEAEAFYIKESTTGNTGWRAFVGVDGTIMFPSRAAFLATTVPAVVTRTAFVVNGNSYGVVRDAGGDIVQTNGQTWLPDGPRTPWHYGAVGDGVANDSAAIVATFARAGQIEDKAGGTFLINDTTIPVTHPTNFCGAGQGATRFVFTNMGGFAGKDGFDISVPLSAPYKSETRFEHCDVVVSGAHGRAGIRTPVNPGGGGNTLFNTVAPKFVFNGMTLGGAVRRFAGANLHTLHGWFDCILSGESDNSEFTNLSIMQPFWAPDDPATWGDTINTSGVRLVGRTGDNGSGPVRNPRFNHWIAHGCGAPVRFEGFVSTPRMSNMDTFANYFGGFVQTGAISTGGGPTLLSEASVSHVQFSGIAGAIRAQAFDYMTIIDADMTDTSFGAGVSVDYSNTWVGIDVVDECRELTLVSPRFYAARPTGTNDHRGVRGRWSASGAAPSFLNISDMFVRNSALTPSASRFTKVLEIENANMVNVTNAFFAGNIVDLLDLSGTAFLSPRVNMLVQKSGAIRGELITLGAGMNWTNVRNLAAPIVGTVRPTNAELPESMFQNFGTTQSDRIEKSESGWMRQIRVISGVAGPTTAEGDGFVNAETTFDYTEPFIEPPSVKASVRTGSFVFANGRALSATQGAFRLGSFVSSAGPFFVEITIEGRWK